MKLSNYFFFGNTLQCRHTHQRLCPQHQVTNLYNNLSCHDWAYPSGTAWGEGWWTPGNFVLTSVRTARELKLRSTNRTLSVGGAFRDLFSLLMPLSFTTADYFMYKWQQLLILYKNIIIQITKNNLSFDNPSWYKYFACSGYTTSRFIILKQTFNSLQYIYICYLKYLT